MEDKIVKTMTRMLLPFIQLYGIFIILNGHISPGGGFAGGAMIGTSLILYTIVFGLPKARKKFSHRAAEFMESGGLILYVAIGLIALIFGLPFLTNIEAHFPLGDPGKILSAGMIPIIMIGIGIKVFSTMVSLFHILIEEEIS